MLQKPELVIFDWDNTLVDSWLAIHQALQVTFRAFERPVWDIEDTKSRTYHSLRKTLDKFFPGCDVDEVKKTYRNAYKNFQHSITPLENARKTLDILQKMGVDIAIISNKHSKFLNQEIDLFGLRSYFRRIIGSGDLPEDKPSPTVIETLVKNQNIKHNRMWFIGDAIVDVQIARNFGCIAILYGNEKYTEAIAKELAPDIRCKDHLALISLLESFNE